MHLRNFAIAIAVLGSTGAAFAAPGAWPLGLPEAASPVMAGIADLNRLLVYIVVATFLLVLALLTWVAIRYNRRANPVPRMDRHNALLEVAWTGIPIIVLVLIAIPALKLLYFEATLPKPDVVIAITGKDGYWVYAYPEEGGFRYASRILDTIAAKHAGEPQLMGVDHPLVVPVDKVVEIRITGADTIHSWPVPALGVKIDAIPGRINHAWFKATAEGKYYGQGSGPCGARGCTPIEVMVVNEPQYEVWLAAVREKLAMRGGAVFAAADE